MSRRSDAKRPPSGSMAPLVAPINPVYWSRFLPDLKLASDLQQGEGFAYFGLGILLLALGGAFSVLVRPPARATVNALAPVLFTTGVLLLVAISPKVTFGARVLFELPQALYAPFAPFRASGRFVLPAFYLMLFLLLCLVAPPAARLGSERGAGHRAVGAIRRHRREIGWYSAPGGARRRSECLEPAADLGGVAVCHRFLPPDAARAPR